VQTAGPIDMLDVAMIRHCIACIAAFASLALCSTSAFAQSAATKELPVVWIFATGGTIAGQASTSTNLTDYKPGVLGEQLVAGVPEIKQVARVRVEQIANVLSPDITVAHWLTLANRINAVLREPDVAGAIVTHGTNTLEETAYFLNLTVKSDRPVVLVGAMRPATAISADGPLNLLNAVRTAVSPEARGKGALVVLNDEINGARDVTKTNTYRVETFKSPELGLLGYVDGDRVNFYRSSTKRHTAQSEFDVSGLTQLPKVDILYSYVQPAPSLIKALLADGARGIVLAGTGAGLISTAERDALTPLQQMPIDSRPVLVRSNRTGNGRVIGRDDYDKMEMIPADNLNPQKARILLMLALTKTHDRREIRRMFEQY
jgi:L-asparaginase